jgi:hypothetical protein
MDPDPGGPNTCRSGSPTLDFRSNLSSAAFSRTDTAENVEVNTKNVLCKVEKSINGKKAPKKICFLHYFGMSFLVNEK